MTDPAPGTVPPVTDRRVPPRGVISRHMQTWLMVGLATAILGIILFTGHTDRPQRSGPATAMQPVAPDAGRLRDYQDRLRLLDERARQQATDTAGDEDQPVRQKQDAASPQTDPIAADKKRRDYESLFAGVLVLSKRPQAQRLAEAGVAPSAGGASAGSGTAASLNGLADALLRAAAQPGNASTNGTAPFDPDPARTVHPSSARTSVSGTRLRQGAFIPVSLVNQVDSRSPGPVVCQVIEPVLTEDAQHVLIPAGARLLGESKPVQGQDAAGVPVAFHTLQIGRHDYPLEQFLGLNGIGEPGLDGKVDQHYWSTFGAASMIGLLTGLSQAVATTGLGRGDGDRTIVIAGSTGEAAAEATAQTFDRLLRRPPHISASPGYRFHVYVSRDLSLPVYSSDAMPIATADSPAR